VSVLSFAEENIRWLIVLLIGLGSAILGTLFSKVTSAATESKHTIINELLVTHQFAYFGFYASVLTAFDLRSIFREVCVFAIIVTFIFFAIGLFTLKHTDANKKVMATNVILAVIALLGTTLLVLSLQSAKIETNPSPVTKTNSECRMWRGVLRNSSTQLRRLTRSEVDGEPLLKRV
jgi:hypothetical protein